MNFDRKTIKMLDDDILFFGSLNCLNISQQGEIFSAHQNTGSGYIPSNPHRCRGTAVNVTDLCFSE